MSLAETAHIHLPSVKVDVSCVHFPFEGCVMRIDVTGAAYDILDEPHLLMSDVRINMPFTLRIGGHEQTLELEGGMLSGGIIIAENGEPKDTRTLITTQPIPLSKVPKNSTFEVTVPLILNCFGTNEHTTLTIEGKLNCQ